MFGMALLGATAASLGRPPLSCLMMRYDARLPVTIMYFVFRVMSKKQKLFCPTWKQPDKVYLQSRV